jgi:hypothetical protein
MLISSVSDGPSDRMPALGQTLPNRAYWAISGVPRSTDIVRPVPLVRFVPGTDMALFDHLVGNRHNSLWHFNTEGLGYLEVVPSRGLAFEWHVQRNFA